ncbi:hypothetical protein [Mycolicibacterium thermoresistibile]
MAKRPAPVRADDERRRKAPQRRRTDRRTEEAPPRPRGGAARRPDRPSRAGRQRPHRSAPQTAPIPTPAGGRGRPASSSAAKARAKARKAKAPKVVRPPLRQRLLTRLSSIDLDPRSWVRRVPFVVLVIGSLGLGLGVTLWLSTGAAERSYQLGAVRETNQALLQQKEALEREVLEAQAAPALAEAARELGMIPSRDTARLVQDPAGHWVVVGTPKPAEGVPPPPLNTPLPDRTAAPVPPPPAAPPPVDQREVPVRISPPGTESRPHLPGAPAPDAVPLAVPGVEAPHGVSELPAVPGPVQVAPDPNSAPEPVAPAPAAPDAAAGVAAAPAPVAIPAEPEVRVDAPPSPEPPVEHFSPVRADPESTG